MATIRPKVKKGLIVALLATILLIAAGGYVFKASKTKQLSSTDGTIAAVNRLAILPSDETPTVTKVVDKTQVSQPFLENAENGDQVVLYFESGRAVVYRPSEDRIVNMGSLETPKPRVFLRDGRTGGIPEQLRSKITSSNEFVLASSDVSERQNYPRTVVVDIAGNRPDVAARLAALLQATVIPLPEAESRPDADLMVIVGDEAE